MTTPSALQLLTPTAWECSQNILIANYRHSAANKEAISTCTLIAGVAQNAIKMVGYAFIGLPQGLCNLESQYYWNHTKLYATLTWACLKAIFSFDSTIEDLQLLEFGSYLDVFGKDKKDYLECTDEDKSVRTSKQCFEALPAHLQYTVLFRIHDRLQSDAAAEYSLSSLDQLANFLYDIKPDSGVRDNATIKWKEAFDSCKKLIEKKEFVLVIGGAWSNQEDEMFRFPKREAIDTILFRRDEQDMRRLRRPWDSKSDSDENLPRFTCLTTSDLQAVLESEGNKELPHKDDCDFLAEFSLCKDDPKFKAYLTKVCNYWVYKLNTESITLLWLVNLYIVAKAIDHNQLKSALATANVNFVDLRDVEGINKTWGPQIIPEVLSLAKSNCKIDGNKGWQKLFASHLATT